MLNQKMNNCEKINYVELPSSDLSATKFFFEKAFGWKFEDFGSEYTTFSGAGLNGGFFQSNLCARTESGSALIVFYSNNLEGTMEKVKAAGGEIVKATFSFPGGRRFHFLEPSGSEFAVWSDKGT